MKPPTTLTQSEQVSLERSLVASAYGDHYPQVQTRNALMILLMLRAGLRIGEAVRLTVVDLLICDEARHVLALRPEICKRSSAREIPLTAPIPDLIDRMNKLWWSLQPPDSLRFAFCRWGESRHITTRHVRRIVSLVSFVTLHRNIHPHALRHTFATNLMRCTNSRVVQQLLGHKNLTSTQIYTHPNADDLANAINAVSQLNNTCTPN